MVEINDQTVFNALQMMDVRKAICEAYGCPTEAVTVIIQDAKTQWGRGGKPYGKEAELSSPFFRLQNGHCTSSIPLSLRRVMKKRQTTIAV